MGPRDNGEGIQVDKSDVGGAQQADATLNIHQRIAAVQRAVDGNLAPDGTAIIRKDGKKVGEYPYVSHDAVSAHIRTAMIAHGVVAVPSVTNHAINGNRTELSVRMKYLNADDPNDAIDVDVVGYGVDSGDKGPGKAMSYACKVAHQKLFLLSSFEDQGGDETEHEGGAKQSDVERARDQVNQADMAATNAIKRSMDSAQSLEAIDDILNDVDTKKLFRRLPQVTVDYMREHAADLKRQMEEGG